MKKILITGKNSYIGTSFQKWMAQYPEAYQVDAISVRGEDWKEKDFSEYDSILHLAGIAHVSRNPKMEELYYQVNRDLTIEIAMKAKAEGVKQFVFMSSIIVYGESTASQRVITAETIPNPSNFYGKSKLEAEEGIQLLETQEFKVAIVRPPMIYGKDSKGNYPKLAKLARYTPVFPDYPNQRSMLHIDNLCEFLKQLIAAQESGLYFPQNREYVKTSELVREIGAVYGKKIYLFKFLNPIIRLLIKQSIVNKIFGNLVYETTMSKYKHNIYQVRDFKNSIQCTEGV
ncbi:NAD-dependent epimerase/dehydratase family protein [Enterococcus sp. LJL98]